MDRIARIVVSCREAGITSGCGTWLRAAILDREGALVGLRLRVPTRPPRRAGACQSVRRLDTVWTSLQDGVAAEPREEHMQDKPRFDRTVEDLGNVVGLEHVNTRVPCQIKATHF